MRWGKDFWKAIIDPKNIATNIVLAIFLLVVLYIGTTLFLNRAQVDVLSSFGNSKLLETSNNKTTIYFTFVNTGTIPLKINNIFFAWFDYADRDTPTQERWNKEKIIFLDENEEEVTETILVPNEKMKIHLTLDKPKNLRSNTQIIQVCPFFEPTKLRGIFDEGITGICNIFYMLTWK